MQLKYLTEQRSENQDKMQEILNTAKSEKRALKEKEISKFNQLKKLIEEIDATIKAEEESRKMDIEEKKESQTSEDKTNESKNEERAFVDYIVSGEER
ncbi:MAG: phage major capsid protein, partial [Oscillospiraceae bacterium]|nr:phage major capsid protein [Oscillospiraceae bacterium]